MAAGPALAQQPTIEDLMRKIDALQRRVDELESQQKASKAQAARPRRSEAATAAATQPPAPPAIAPAPAPAAAPAATATAKVEPTPQPFETTVPGLLPPEPMGNQFENEDALRSDLPGMSIRIPGTDSMVRLYGFAKLSGWYDLNGRNQTDAPTAQTIPLNNSAADMQGGDFGMTARFSRIGVDTRTLTGWGTLETRIEGDFGGGSPTSSNAVFRLRQAWAELGTEEFRVLIGQANSLWNEGVFETIIDATNLNQSFVRQAQVRATATLAPGLTGMVSLEAPATQYTSAAGVFTPDSSVTGSPSPAFDAAPDLLGRLTYRNDGLVLDLRALLRELSIRTAGTTAAPPALTRTAAGWGLAAHARLPMRWFSEAFGPDELIGMAYYGQGIGRYFPGNTSGQDALSNIGLPGTFNGFSFNPLPTYGVIAAYRRFWTTQLRSNFSYAYAHEDYPSYALGFTPGTVSALGLNTNMQQVFANLIWSPFATVRDGVFGSGWLDVGLEYVYTRRDLFGGSAQSGSVGSGLGVANRFLAAAVGRF
ncbi:MAG TPA: DcaP family trimeric outer membrane transporter [Acetobacteraceae bacterium]|nr:DcaP family trimeric outer membrane transporter [Acetobacteraceae bacterium]